MAECPVCFETLSQKIATTPPCKHAICLPCLMSLRQQKCVLCRCDLSALIPQPQVRRGTDEGLTPSMLFRPAYDDMYVDALLRLHDRERRDIRRIGRGAHITLVRLADDSSDEEQLTEPLFIDDRDT
jgi:hypothetical protein